MLACTFVPISWDLSENRGNSFSEADEQALRGIRGPLAIEAHLAPEDPRRFDFEHHAPAARIAHPRTEHFAPLFVSMGATADTWSDAHSAVDGFWYGMAKRSFEIN